MTKNVPLVKGWGGNTSQKNYSGKKKRKEENIGGLKSHFTEKFKNKLVRQFWGLKGVWILLSVLENSRPLFLRYIWGPNL